MRPRPCCSSALSPPDAGAAHGQQQPHHERSVIRGQATPSIPAASPFSLLARSGDAGGSSGDGKSLVVFKGEGAGQLIEAPSQTKAKYTPTASVIKRMAAHWPRPEWHAPWKNYRVISGHLGWVRSVAVDPSNEFFVTGSADRCIKVWDLATGTLKLTLTGHIEQVMGASRERRVSAPSPRPCQASPRPARLGETTLCFEAFSLNGPLPAPQAWS